MELTDSLSKVKKIELDKTWETLVEPTLKPRDVRDVWLLIFVLDEIASSNDNVVSIARRTIQRNLFIVDGRRLSKRVKRLSEDGWVSQFPTQHGRSYKYGPGPLLLNTQNLHFDWGKLAEQVCGANGLLSELVDSSTRAHGYLNNSGVMCLAAIKSANKPIQPKELKKHLSFFMSPATVTRALKKLKSLNLVEINQSGYLPAPNWKTILNQYENASGCDKRDEKIQKTTRAETIKYQKEQQLGSNASQKNWHFGWLEAG